MEVKKARGSSSEDLKTKQLKGFLSQSQTHIKDEKHMKNDKKNKNKKNKNK